MRSWENEVGDQEPFALAVNRQLRKRCLELGVKCFRRERVCMERFLVSGVTHTGATQLVDRQMRGASVR